MFLGNTNKIVYITGFESESHIIISNIYTFYTYPYILKIIRHYSKILYWKSSKRFSYALYDKKSKINKLLISIDVGNKVPTIILLSSALQYYKIHIEKIYYK